MSRSIYPRPNHEHAEMASRILDHHERTVAKAIALPVPIEMIIEQTYQLTIQWDEISERDGEIILGALSSRERVIVLNSRHETMFGQWVGPERFTLAHELAHWIYDADEPAQLAFDFEAADKQQFCYHRETPGLSELNRVREMNANKLAAHLLMPEELVRAANIAEVLGDISGTAQRWQVSCSALRIRLEELSLIDKQNTHRRPFW